MSTSRSRHLDPEQYCMLRHLAQHSLQTMIRTTRIAVQQGVFFCFAYTLAHRLPFCPGASPVSLRQCASLQSRFSTSSMMHYNFRSHRNLYATAALEFTHPKIQRRPVCHTGRRLYQLILTPFAASGLAALLSLHTSSEAFTAEMVGGQTPKSTIQ